VPIGVPGVCHRWWFGSGYLNRPELTERNLFITPSTSQDPPLQNWGLGSLPADGIEFIGRIDHQVKIRGFRIELGTLRPKPTPGCEETVVVLEG